MRFLLSVFLFLAVLQTRAADVPEVVMARRHAVKSDSGKVILRSFDDRQLKAYAKQKDFVYDDVAPLGESLWNRFWRWFWSLIEKVLGNEVSGGIIKYIVIAALIALVVFLVLKFIGLDLKILSRKSREVEVPYHESDENIHVINFNQEIENAIARGNYRVAVRLLYLRALKKLSDSNLIHWQPEKTNQAYISEIQDMEKRQQFSKLTHQFEYVWYGEFFVNKDSFNQIRNTFEQFNQPAS